MYHKKTPKDEGPDKTPFTLYHPYPKSDSERPQVEEFYQVVSIDPGTVNFGFRIEKRFLNGNIFTIVFEKIQFTSGEEGFMINNTYQQITNFLDSYFDFLMNSHFIIIERQMKENYKRVRISQHLITYFCIKLINSPLMPQIIEIDSTLKTRELHPKKNRHEMNKTGVKKWAKEEAKRLLIMREDQTGLAKLASTKKKDDLADTVIQIEAFFKYKGLPLTRNPINLDVIIS